MNHSPANKGRQIRAYYEEGEAACTAERIAKETELPVERVRFVCAVEGYPLVAVTDVRVVH